MAVTNFLDGRIAVFHPEHSLLDGKLIRPALVNWSAIGSVSVKEARRFATELQKATCLAADLNIEHGIYEDGRPD